MSSRATDDGEEIPEKGEPLARAGGRGGDCRFQPGRGGIWLNGGPVGCDGSLILALANGTEQLRFDPDGKVFVRGEVVAYRQDIFDAFVLWLGDARVYSEPAEDPNDGDSIVVRGSETKP